MNPYEIQRKHANLLFAEGLQDLDEAEAVERAVHLLTELAAVVENELTIRLRIDPDFPFADEVVSRVLTVREFLPKVHLILKGLRAYVPALDQGAKDPRRAHLVLTGWVRTIDKIPAMYDSLMQTRGYFSAAWA